MTEPSSGAEAGKNTGTKEIMQQCEEKREKGVRPAKVEPDRAAGGREKVDGEELAGEGVGNQCSS